MSASREVAAVLLLRADGAVLLQHRDEKAGLKHAGMWTPPGGHREGEETLEQCARREFHEETGYRLAELTLLDRVIDHTEDGAPDTCVSVFWSRYDDWQAVYCYEGQDLKFVPRDRADLHRIPDYLVALWDRALAAAAIPLARPMAP